MLSGSSVGMLPHELRSELGVPLGLLSDCRIALRPVLVTAVDLAGFRAAELHRAFGVDRPLSRVVMLGQADQREEQSKPGDGRPDDSGGSQSA